MRDSLSGQMFSEYMKPQPQPLTLRQKGMIRKIQHVPEVSSRTDLKDQRKVLAHSPDPGAAPVAFA